jgi:hypothetical protein
MDVDRCQLEIDSTKSAETTITAINDRYDDGSRHKWNRIETAVHLSILVTRS